MTFFIIKDSTDFSRLLEKYVATIHDHLIREAFLYLKHPCVFWSKAWRVTYEEIHVKAHEFIRISFFAWAPISLTFVIPLKNRILKESSLNCKNIIIGETLVKLSEEIFKLFNVAEKFMRGFSISLLRIYVIDCDLLDLS